MLLVHVTAKFVFEATQAATSTSFAVLNSAVSREVRQKCREVGTICAQYPEENNKVLCVATIITVNTLSAAHLHQELDENWHKLRGQGGGWGRGGNLANPRRVVFLSKGFCFVQEVCETG